MFIHCPTKKENCFCNIDLTEEPVALNWILQGDSAPSPDKNLALNKAVLNSCCLQILLDGTSTTEDLNGLTGLLIKDFTSVLHLEELDGQSIDGQSTKTDFLLSFSFPSTDDSLALQQLFRKTTVDYNICVAKKAATVYLYWNYRYNFLSLITVSLILQPSWEPILERYKAVVKFTSSLSGIQTNDLCETSAVISHVLISSFAVQIYDLSYIHLFIRTLQMSTTDC